MTKRLGKDQRNKFVAEFEANCKIDSTEILLRESRCMKQEVKTEEH